MSLDRHNGLMGLGWSTMPKDPAIFRSLVRSRMNGLHLVIWSPCLSVATLPLKPLSLQPLHDHLLRSMGSQERPSVLG